MNSVISFAEIAISSNTTVKDIIGKMAEKLQLSQDDLKGYDLYSRIPDNNSLFRMFSLFYFIFAALTYLLENKYTKLGTLCSLKHDQPIPDVWRLLEKFYSMNLHKHPFMQGSHLKQLKTRKSRM